MKCEATQLDHDDCTLRVSGSEAADGPMKIWGSQASLLDCTSAAAAAL